MNLTHVREVDGGLSRNTVLGEEESKRVLTLVWDGG